MKRITFIYCTMSIFLAACSGEESNETQDVSKEDEIEKVEEGIEETHSLEIVNFVNESEEDKSLGKLPYSYNSFEYTTAGAVYDEAGKTLSIYFANYDNPKIVYGMCCDETEAGDQKTLSFIIKHDGDNNIDGKASFINYTDTSNFIGLNMVDRTMTGDYEMKDGYVEGNFTYVNDKDSTAFIKTEFKLNLREE